MDGVNFELVGETFSALASTESTELRTSIYICVC